MSKDSLCTVILCFNKLMLKYIFEALLSDIVLNLTTATDVADIAVICHGN